MFEKMTDMLLDAVYFVWDRIVDALIALRLVTEEFPEDPAAGTAAQLDAAPAEAAAAAETTVPAASGTETFALLLAEGPEQQPAGAEALAALLIKEAGAQPIIATETLAVLLAKEPEAQPAGAMLPAAQAA